MIKERKLYAVILSLFEHHSIEQLLCDIVVFICSDCTRDFFFIVNVLDCKQNNSFITSFVDVLFFGYLVNVAYLYMIYAFDSNR